MLPLLSRPRGISTYLFYRATPCEAPLQSIATRGYRPYPELNHKRMKILQKSTAIKRLKMHNKNNLDRVMSGLRVGAIAAKPMFAQASLTAGVSCCVRACGQLRSANMSFAQVAPQAASQAAIASPPSGSLRSYASIGQ